MVREAKGLGKEKSWERKFFGTKGLGNDSSHNEWSRGLFVVGKALY